MKLLATVSSLDARDRRALALGVGVVAPLLIAMLVIRPYVSALLEHRQALASERTLLAREHRAALDLPGDRRALAALDSELLLLAPRLFAGSDVVTESAELARYAAQQARSVGLRVDQVETQTRIDSASVTEASQKPARDRMPDGDLRISLRARGDIVAIHAFLHAIEDGPKLVRVERIEIVRGSEGDDSEEALTFATVLAARARTMLGPNAVAVASPVGAANERVATSIVDTSGAEGSDLSRDPFRAGGLLPNAVARLKPPADTVLPVSVAAVRLLGTVVRVNGGFALCQLPADIPRMVRVGERLGELTLISLEQGHVVFQAPRGARLDLFLSNTRS